MKNQRSLVGKIAALPYDIREQLNCRLRDGQTAPLILPWLNALPIVQEILAGQFSGAPVNSQNLCNWRASGYQRWLAVQTPHAGATTNSHGLRHSRAARDLASGVTALATHQLFQVLHPGSAEKISNDDFLKALPSITTLVKANQNEARLKLAKRRIRQKDAQLQVTRANHQRETAVFVIRSLYDERIHLVDAADISDEQKIELVGRLLYGKLWESNPISSEKGPYNGSVQPSPSDNQLESTEITTNQPFSVEKI